MYVQYSFATRRAWPDMRDEVTDTDILSAGVVFMAVTSLFYLLASGL